MASLASTVGSATVYLRISPRPRNISDNREILNVLRRFGDVNFFKHNKQEPHLLGSKTAHRSFVASFRTRTAAQNLIKASPLTFTLAPLGTPLESTRNSIAGTEDAETNAQEDDGFSTFLRQRGVNAEDMRSEPAEDDTSIMTTPSKIQAQRALGKATSDSEATGNSSSPWGAFGSSGGIPLRTGRRTGGPSPLDAITSSNPMRNRKSAVSESRPGAITFKLFADFSLRDALPHVQDSDFYGPFLTKDRKMINQSDLSMYEVDLGRSVPIKGLEVFRKPGKAWGWVREKTTALEGEQMTVRKMMNSGKK